MQKKYFTHLQKSVCKNFLTKIFLFTTEPDEHFLVLDYLRTTILMIVKLELMIKLLLIEVMLNMYIV